jgi:hypothetical protein
MHIVILNGNSGQPVSWGSEQECKDWLIGKARIFAGTDQHQYEQYVHSIADEGTLVTENPYRNYKIKEV